jgi:hypothetical protein
MNPFLVLDLPLGCTDDQVRAAYHERLRQHTPEQDPAGFQMLQEAYAALRTERDRWRWHLLNQDLPAESPLEALEKLARLPGRARLPGTAALQSLLTACAAAAQRDLTSPQKK